MQTVSIHSFWNAIRIIVATLRAGFFPASIVPVTLGATLAFYKTSRWDWGLFGWTVLGIVFVHAAANMANDYFDHKSGNDDINQTFLHPFSGGSRTIQNGLITPRQVAQLSSVCLVLSLAVAARLVAWVGFPVLLPAIAGIATGYFYTAPPWKLASRGWGEIIVGLDFGILPVVGSYYVQTGEWSWTAVLFSLPIAILIMAVLFVNQFPDYDADKAVGKNNWLVRLGRHRGTHLYATLMTAWVIGLLLAIWPGGAPKTLLLGLAGILIAIPAIQTVRMYHDVPEKMAPACRLTISLHTGIGIVMCTTLALSSSQ